MIGADHPLKTAALNEPFVETRGDPNCQISSFCKPFSPSIHPDSLVMSMV
jgi:hypothetical protein